jgi:3-oxoacyl-[acyl-carrier-protein] synthase-3
MIKVAGTGSYLPEKVLTNKDLEEMVCTTDEWITQRTGITERRIASENEATSDLALIAAQNAIEAAGLTPRDIDFIIVGTSTPDYAIPAVAPIVQQKLGCGKIPAFDVNSVCASFAYAFLTMYGIMAGGAYKNCLVIGADVYSRIMNWKDRSSCILFGDGAGAMILQFDPSRKGILGQLFGADGEGADSIIIPVGGSRKPVRDCRDFETDDLYFQMDGRRVYNFTITVIPEACEQLISNAGLKATDLDWIILHQANLRIIDAVAKRLELPLDKFSEYSKNREYLIGFHSNSH